MQRIPAFANSRPVIQLMLLLFLLLTSLLLSTLAALLMLVPVYGSSILSDIAAFSDPSNPANVLALKFMQVVNQLGFFFLPVFIFAFLVSDNAFKYLRLNRFPPGKVLWSSIALMFIALPFIAWLIEWNEGLLLPAWLSGVEAWMKEKEEQAALLTDAFLATSSLAGFSVNMLMMAILPSLGEELLFRGVLLRLFREWSKNIHVAVLLSALLFSAIHLQFYGFFPRFVLGIALGYAFVWSRSVWVPVIMHFVNNATAVVAAFLFSSGITGTDYEELGKSPSAVIVSLSLALSLILMYYIYKTTTPRSILRAP